MKSLKYSFLFTSALALLTLAGCATFKSGPPRDSGFYKEAQSFENLEAVPAEIVNDMQIISEQGRLFSAGEDQRLYVRPEQPRPQQGSVILAEQNNNLPDKSQRRPANTSSQSKDLKNKSGVQQTAQINEKDVILKSENGPLAKSKASQSGGPLNFSKTSGVKGGKTIMYTVKLGDTLMEIAFEKHGDYLRWKEIYHANKNKMKNPRKMQIGTVLTINNVKYVYIKRDGKPYLIRKNDTLKSIAKKLYGTKSRWKDIWKNNPQLIRNPKKIYAGFTLYYQPKDKALPLPSRQPTGSQKVSN